MVVRIHNVGKWAKLSAAVPQVLDMPGRVGRKVRLSVNCPAPTALMLVEVERDDARTTFLWAGQGLQDIEFFAVGSVQVVATSEDDVWYFTNEGDHTAIRNVDAVSFTKIATRRARNPELEAIMWKAELNMNRRMARLEEEMMQRVNAAARIDRDTGEIVEERTGDAGGDTGEEPGVDSVAGSGSEPAPDAGAGTAAAAAAAGTGGTSPAPK